MLITRPVLERIRRGEIDLVFRRWKRPTVRTGGTLRTTVGMLDVIAVDMVSRDEIDATSARRAGYDEPEVLLADLDRRSDGVLYRVEVRPGGPDPRDQLRERADLDADEMTAVRRRLDRLDAASRRGPWTRDVLRRIADQPHVRAQDLADAVDADKATFKRDVRKLKALGLTISHSPGYELSPRGHTVLRELEGDEDLR